MASNEKRIILKEIDPMEIYGVNNRLLERIKKYFPKLKIVARGSDIILNGNLKDIKLFEERLNALIEIRKIKRTLNEDDIDRLFDYENFPSIMKVEENLSVREDAYTIVYGNEGRIIKARTKNQKKLVDEYYKNDRLFAIGPAGTGKTYTAIALAVRALKNKEVKKLILTRPAVEAGERLGFLPGDMKEKIDPYLQPLYDALQDMIPAAKLQELMDTNVIQIAPLAFMRGRTLNDAVVILDEAQNTTSAQIKMFLTRMGTDAKMIITGDMTQIDLPRGQMSGLKEALNILSDIEGISVINFNKKDIVRHKLVTRIVDAYEKYDKEQKAARDK